MKRMHTSTCFAVAAVVLLGFTSAIVGGQAPSAVKVFDGATLIDGTGAAAIPNGRVVIRGDRIIAAGPADRTPSPAGADVVDLRGKYILPGLIDAHAHYRNWQGELFLNYGITTVFEIGDYTEWLFALKDSVQKGKIYAPRFYVAGSMIQAATGGRDSFSVGAKQVKAVDQYRFPVRNEAEGQEAVRTLLGQGMDLIKVEQSLTGSMLKAVTAEAHSHGKAVLAHTSDVRDATANGVNGVAHLWGVSATLMSPEHRNAYFRGEIACPYAWMEPDQIDGLVKLMVSNDVYLNPLLVHEHKAVTEHAAEFEAEVARVLTDSNLNYISLNDRAGIFSMFHRVRNYSLALGMFPPLDRLTPEQAAEFRRGYDNAKEFTRRFVKAGGKLFTGSSGGSTNMPGLSLHYELRAVTDLGISPMEALLSVTRYPADLLRVGDQVGTVAPGRFADLLVVTADPLADIRNLKKIDRVIRNGVQIERAYHPNYSISIPDPLNLVDTPNYPTPFIGTIEPRMVTEGAQAFTIEITGERFTPVSIVYVREMGLKTTFVNPTVLKAEVPAELVQVAQTIPVRVMTPPPGGGASKNYGLIVKFR